MFKHLFLSMPCSLALISVAKGLGASVGVCHSSGVESSSREMQETQVQNRGHRRAAARSLLEIQRELSRSSASWALML